MANLGFIGTGGMGSGMAANLLKAGHKLIVTDLRREQCQGLGKSGRGIQGLAQSGGGILRRGVLDVALQPSGASRRLGQGWTARSDQRRQDSGSISAASIRRPSLASMLSSAKRVGRFSTARRAASKRRLRPARCRCGCRARKRCSISTRISSRRWATRSFSSANWAMPSW